jgi:mannosyl-3-phosphoglycerate phosphatase
MVPFIVFTDLDGTLLDSITYDFAPARQALEVLKSRNIPLILTTSKTLAEVEPIRTRLANADPFIVENGGGLFVPEGYFPFPLPGTSRLQGYQVVEREPPYEVLRQVLVDVRNAMGPVVRGFGDMSAGEVAERTGLTLVEAQLAKQRRYDEPFVVLGPSRLAEEICAFIQRRGLCSSSGGRFYHVTGPGNKGDSCRRLMEYYRHPVSDTGQKFVTVALGDSPNDLPMLAAVDRPILLQNPRNSHDCSIDLPHLIRSQGKGPAAWNRAILELLETTPLRPIGG